MLSMPWNAACSRSILWNISRKVSNCSWAHLPVCDRQTAHFLRVRYLRARKTVLQLLQIISAALPSVLMTPIIRRTEREYDGSSRREDKSKGRVGGCS